MCTFETPEMCSFESALTASAEASGSNEDIDLPEFGFVARIRTLLRRCGPWRRSASQRNAIEDSLDDPSLTSQSLARTFRISARYLHRTFSVGG